MGVIKWGERASTVSPPSSASSSTHIINYLNCMVTLRVLAGSSYLLELSLSEPMAYRLSPNKCQSARLRSFSLIISFSNYFYSDILVLSILWRRYLEEVCSLCLCKNLRSYYFYWFVSSFKWITFLSLTAPACASLVHQSTFSRSNS